MTIKKLNLFPDHILYVPFISVLLEICFVSYIEKKYFATDNKIPSSVLSPSK